MKKLFTLVVILSIVGTSCIKKEYDLNRDLDLTIRVGGDVTYVPIATTDTLRISDFLNTDDIDLLTHLHGGYAIVKDSSMVIDVPEIKSFDIDPIEINEQRIIDFGGDFGGFPNMTFPDVLGLDQTVESNFYLEPTPFGILEGVRLGLPGQRIALQAINNLITDGTLGIPTTDTLPLMARMEETTSIDISANVLQDNGYIKNVDTVWLTNTSGFRVRADILGNIPNGISLLIDSLRLEFPLGKVNLNTDSTGVIATNIFQIINVPITGSGLSLNVPIKSFTNIFDPLTGNVGLTESVDIYAKYSLIGDYTGGNFPTSEGNAPKMHLVVTPDLTFESATLTLDIDKMDFGLPRTAEHFNVFEPIDEEDVIIERLDSITFNAGTQIALNMNLTEQYGYILNNLLVDLKITFPKDLMVAPRAGLNTTTNIYQQPFSFDGINPQNLIFNLRGLKFTSETFSNNTIDIQDSITVEASISLKNPRVNTKAIQNIKLNLDVNGGTDIVLNKIYARIKFDIPMEDSETIDLSDLSPILMNNRDSLILDVNPYLSLDLNTNLPIEFGIAAILKSFKDGEEINDLSIPIDVDPATGPTTKLWVAKDHSLMPQGQGYTHVPVDLGSAVRTLPDSIVIQMDGEINADIVFDMNTEYYADMNYKFVVPLSFGQEFKIVLTDTLENLKASIGEALNGNKIALTAFATNTIPLDLEATFIPLDEDRNPISEVEILPLLIKAGAKPTDDPPARLVIDDKNKDHGIIRMRHLVLQFRGTAGAGTVHEPLKPADFIQLKLQAEINGGMIIDLNDFLNNKDEEEED